MFSLVLNLEFWGVEYSSITYLGKVILTNVSFQGGIFDPNVYGFLDCPGKAMPFPAHYTKVIHSGGKWWCGGYVLVRMLLSIPLSFFKCSSGFYNVFHIAFSPIAFVPVGYTTLDCMGSLFFGDTNMFLIVMLPLKCVLMPYLPHMPLMLLQSPCTYGMTMYPLYVLLF